MGFDYFTMYEDAHWESMTKWLKHPEDDLNTSSIPLLLQYYPLAYVMRKPREEKREK